MFSLQWDRPMEWSQERKSESEIRSVVSDSLQPHGLYSPWNSPGQNTGMGSLSLLQGIFPTQGSNPGLPHCRQILDQLRHKGDPRILEWVAYPFSTRSSWPRNWTRVSCIAGGFFTNWGTREAQRAERLCQYIFLLEAQKAYETPLAKYYEAINYVFCRRPTVRIAEWTTPDRTRGYSVSRGWSQRRESRMPEARNTSQCSAQASHIRDVTFSEMVLWNGQQPRRI